LLFEKLGIQITAGNIAGFIVSGMVGFVESNDPRRELMSQIASTVFILGTISGEKSDRYWLAGH
jgi:hypothetical protein